jgi:hypothetical protein
VPAQFTAAAVLSRANQERAPTGGSSHDLEAAALDSSARRMKDLPTEFGVMLLSVGVVGVILPGLVGIPALVVGGLVLWPGAFGGLDAWLRRRHSRLHRVGMQQLIRFLDDLERRYPVASQERREAPIPALRPSD